MTKVLGHNRVSDERFLGARVREGFTDQSTYLVPWQCLPHMGRITSPKPQMLVHNP